MPPLPNRAELSRKGQEARTRVPPTVHAAWKPAADRPDPIALLEEQAKTRVPELVPVRYGRMAVSPFTFFRGAALPMAADLAPTPTSGFTVQLAGDAHLSNFGLFASPERNLLFDMNDFDETHRGPWEWDLKRLAASIVVAARSRGFDAHQAAHAVHATVHSYRTRMAEYAAMRAIDIYYARVDATTSRPTSTSGRGPISRPRCGPPPTTMRSTSCQSSPPSGPTASVGSSTIRRRSTTIHRSARRSRRASWRPIGARSRRIAATYSIGISSSTAPSRSSAWEASDWRPSRRCSRAATRMIRCSSRSRRRRHRS